MLLRIAIASILAAIGSISPARAQTQDPQAFSIPSPLTLDQALTLWKEHGIDLLIAEAAVQGAEGDVAAAGAIPNPSLSVSYGRSAYFESCSPGTCPGIPPVISGSLSDSAAIADSLAGKRRLRVEVAKAAWAAARKSRDDAQRVLEAQVKQQFVQVLIAQDALKLVQEVARTSAKILELTETRYRVGAVSEADVARVDTARLEADQAVDTAVQNLRQARVGLAFLLGVRGTITDFEAVGPQLLHYQAPQRYQGAKSAELLRVAIERRADLLAARLLRDRAEAAVRLARRQRFPDVALSLTYSQQGTGTSAVTPPSFIVGLSSPLPVLYQQQGEIQRAEADLRSQILLVEKTESAVASDVEAAYSGFVTAEQLVKRMEGGLLDRARQARDLVLIQFQKGAASLLEYLDAQRTYTSTHLEYRQDLIAYWTSLFKLEQAVGADLQ